MEIQLKEKERIDDLGLNNMKIIQTPEGFCFGMDSVLLSDFAKEMKPGCTCVDLGTGTGILGILLCAKTKLSKIIGVEIQEEVADMAKRSILLNGLDSKFQIYNFNITDLFTENNKEEVEIAKDFITNGMYYDNYSIGPTYEMKNVIKYLVKGIYREQNGLEADYGY